MNQNALLNSGILFFLCLGFLSAFGQEENNTPSNFAVVEQMPRFPGCEHLEKSDKKIKDCSNKKLVEFLYKNLEYPKEARDKGIEGMCVVQFVVKSNGFLEEIKVVRDIGGGCGDASIDVVRKMNEMEERWIPSKQRGVDVDVLYTLPVKFKLE